MRALLRSPRFVPRSRLHSSSLYTAESVLPRDLFLQQSQPNSFYPRSVTDLADGPLYNIDVSESLHDPDLQALLHARTRLFQNFVGDSLPLLFHELACALCGLAEMSVVVATGNASPDPPLSRVHIPQTTLRGVGKRYFLMQAQASTTFADTGHLAHHHRELQHSLMVLSDTDSLVCDFMKRNSLYDVVIPYRGAHAAGAVCASKAQDFRSVIRDQTCVGSFFTLLGLLVSKYGSASVRDSFWNPKVLHPHLGIIKIATDYHNNTA